MLQEIEKARLLERAVLPAPDRARLLQRMAEGYASQGMHAQAYAELRRANEAAQQGQQSVRDTQLLPWARYEIARREVAELADLRHRAEADRLALQAREAQQRALWAALIAAGRPARRRGLVRGAQPAAAASVPTWCSVTRSPGCPTGVPCSPSRSSSLRCAGAWTSS